MKQLKLDEVKDPTTLRKIANATSSRGRKQRALKKMKKLEGKVTKAEKEAAKE